MMMIARESMASNRSLEGEKSLIKLMFWKDTKQQTPKSVFLV